MSVCVRDPTRLNLTLFQSLSTLELVDCDLSTSALAGFRSVCGSLRILTCSNSLEELRHLLAPATGASLPCSVLAVLSQRRTKSWLPLED